MGQLLVRNLDDAVIDQLKSKALERGTSLEQVARDVLTQAANVSDRQAWIERLDAMRATTTLDPDCDSVAEIRADRDALSRRFDPDLPIPGGAGG